MQKGLASTGKKEATNDRGICPLRDQSVLKSPLEDRTWTSYASANVDCFGKDTNIVVYSYFRGLYAWIFFSGCSNWGCRLYMRKCDITDCHELEGKAEA